MVRKTILAACVFVAVILTCGIFITDIGKMNVVPASTINNSFGKTIIIDPGHGGEDGGAVACDGTPESGLNLSISIKIRDIFELFGVKTIMTRDSDEVHFAVGDTIKSRKASEMRGRIELINSTPDAFLLSIHQNFFTQQKYNGAQVFYSAGDPAGAETAVFIQEYLRLGVNPQNTRKASTISESVYLMKHKNCSGILIECGFLSNEAETIKLKTDEYQQQIAKAVCAGLMQYYVCSG